MTYPKVDFLPDQVSGTTADAVRVGVVASPKFPEIEERILELMPIRSKGE